MFQRGEATLPFDCVDAINGTKHKKGDVLYLEGYDVRVLKKI